MDYTLAKQLADAGFVLSGKRSLLGLYEKVYAPANNGMLSADHVLVPSLSELIAACGEEFWSLYREDGKFLAVGCDAVNRHKEWGSTPAEAVARLWLALKSRSNITSSHSSSS